MIYPNTGPSRRYPIPDRERAALARVAKLCAGAGLHFYHQSDPRGCPLYIAGEPMTASNYNSVGIGIG